MWVGGVPPLAAAVLMIFVLPSDKKVIAFGEEEQAKASESGEEPVKKALGAKC